MGVCARVMRLAMATTALWPITAFAQDPGVTSPNEDPAAVENEAPENAENLIIVTAQKREERLVDVPISITSNSAETIERSNIEGLIDLAKVTPGLVTNRFGVAVQPAIRGVTTRLGENSVATYVDGFYIPNAVSLNFDFNNIERVDVLKGPQGTLFGRNATGGAIVITTKNPSFDPHVEAEFGIEELGGLQAGFYATTGITDTVAIDLAADYRKSDGYIYNVTGGDPINDTQHQNYRARIMWEPTDGARLTLTGEYGYLEDATTAASFTFYQNRLLPGSTAKNVISANHEPENKADWRAIYLKGEYDFGDLNFASYSSYRHDTNDLDVDLDGSATAQLVNVLWHTDQRTFQQEFNLGNSGPGPIDWVVGLYYFNDAYDRKDVPGNIIVSPTTNQILLDTEAAAAFADVSYQVTDRFTLTAGARYNWEKKIASFRAPLNGNPTVFQRGEADYQNLSPRLIARYELANNTNVYASWSRGFKSGTFNTTAVTIAPTQPERLDAFEVGFKTASSGFSFDAAAFYYDWKQIQVARFDPTIPGGNIIFNAAAAEVYGAEAQVSYAVTERLNVRLNGAYTHGEYTNFPDAIVSVPSVPTNPLSTNVTRSQDWSGTQLIRTPEFTSNLSFDYEQPTGIGDFIFSGNVYYTSEYLPNTARESPITGEPDLTSGPYTLVNLTLTYKPTENLAVSLYGRNVLDTEYILGTDASAFGQWRLYGEPRVIGAKVEVSF